MNGRDLMHRCAQLSGECIVALFAEGAQTHIALWYGISMPAAQRIVDRPHVRRIHRLRALHRLERWPHDQFELQSTGRARRATLRAMRVHVGQCERTSVDSTLRTFSLSALSHLNAWIRRVQRRVQLIMVFSMSLNLNKQYTLSLLRTRRARIILYNPCAIVHLDVIANLCGAVEDKR